MSKLRRKFITVLAVLFCTLLALSTALFIPKKSADALVPVGADSINLNLNATNERLFNYDELTALYDNIYSGSKNYEELSNNLGTTRGEVSRQHSDMTPTVVTFGGRAWNVVAASKNQNGDVVATLWLAASENTENTKYSAFASSTVSVYSSSEYSMSLVRATLVGTTTDDPDYNISVRGAYNSYATGINANNITTGGEGTQKAIWATILQKYGTFIDSPFSVCGASGYQATERASLALCSVESLVANDAYTIISASLGTGDGVWNSQATQSVQNCTNYDRWKYDKLWLPSLAEIGMRGDNDPLGPAAKGYWGIDDKNVRANGADNWLRSSTNDMSYPFTAWAQGDGSPPYLATTSNPVRPALHLNLKKADEEARKVFFGIDRAGNSVTTENIDGANVKVASKEGTYTGNDVKINVIDYGMLTQSGNTPSGAVYNTDGEFSATKPGETEDKTYEIIVTPTVLSQTTGHGFYWADAATEAEKTAPRRYRIKIKLANIDVHWGNFNVTSGGSLLQDSSPQVVGGTSVEQTIKVKYYIVTPGSNAQPPTGDDDWIENDSDHANDFIASQSGTYTVYYKVTADFHNPTEVKSYEVTVSSDSVKVTLNGNVSIGSATYSEGDALYLTEENQAWLKGQLQSRLTFTSTSTNTAISGNDLTTLWDRLEIYPFTYNANNVKVNYTPNSNGYYDVGTYLFGVRYKSTVSAADQTYSFTWDMQDGKEVHPTFTVNKKTVKVKVVADGDGATLTHVYGDTPVKMTYALVNEHFFDANGESIDDLKLWENFTINDTDGDTIKSTTPAGTYYMIGAALESNYDVQFDSNNSPYVITKRPVTLKVTDEEVPYGTSFDNYTYKLMTVIDGNIIDVDDLETLTANAVYSLKKNGVDTNFSSTLLRGEYELYAEVEADNYIFTVEYGTLKIIKANVNMSGVRLENKGYEYDGNPHPAQISGTLPDGVTVSYRYVNMADGSESADAPVEIGLYLVYASFTHNDPDNYNEIPDKAAYIRIAATLDEANQAFPSLPSDEDIEEAAQLAKKKQDAKKSLDEEAKAKKDEIDADPNLTAEEKQAAKSQIEEERQKGNSAIDSATSESGVEQAFDNGKGKIDSAAELAEKKGEAKKSLENAAKAKKEEIDANDTLTDEEKDEAKAKVDAELAAGKSEIDSATNVSGVESAFDDGKLSIEKIKGIHKEDSSFPWWIIALIAGVLALLALLIIVIVKRRQTADGEDEYDDYYDDEYDFDEEEIEEDYEDGEDF